MLRERDLDEMKRNSEQRERDAKAAELRADADKMAALEKKVEETRVSCWHMQRLDETVASGRSKRLLDMEELFGPIPASWPPSKSPADFDFFGMMPSGAMAKDVG